MFGGEQQNGRRPGTESVALIVSLADAFVAANNEKILQERTLLFHRMVDLVWQTLAPFVLRGVVLPTGPSLTKDRAPHHVSFCVRSMHRRDLLREFHKRGVLASGGSACHASVDMPSHVLVAMKVPLDFIHGSIRITFSHVNQVSEVRDVLCVVLEDVLQMVEKKKGEVCSMRDRKDV